MIQKKIKALILGIFLFCPSFYYAYSQDRPPIKIGVQLSIDVNGPYEGTIRSTLTNKLRSFNDVSLVESGGIYKLSILGMEHKLKGGQVSGIVFSIVVLSPENPSFYEKMLLSLGDLNDKQKSFLIKWFTSDRYIYENSWMQSGSYDNIKAICEEIISTFDADYLERVRKYIK
jgi:hypothetical protein